MERSPSTVPSSVVALASGDEPSKNSFVGCVSRKATDSDTANDRIQRVNFILKQFRFFLLKKIQIEALHGKQAQGIISTESDVEEAEYLLGDSADRCALEGFGGINNRLLIDDGIAITIDSATITYPDDQTRALIISLVLKFLFLLKITF